MHRASCRFMPLCGITETLSDVESVRVVHTEFAVAKKNVEIIIDRDHNGVHDLMEIDDHEHDR